MPQIPVYEGQQVAQRQLNYDQASADSFGAVQGRTLNALGQAGGQVGEALDRINEREVQREVFDAEARAKQAYLEYSTQAMKEGQGAAAKGITERTRQFWQKTQEDIGQKLGNPMAQRMFARSVQQQALAGVSEFSRFENQQLEIDAGQKLDATVSSSVRLAAQIPTDENIAKQIEASRAALTLYGQNRWSPEVLQEKVAAATSATHLAVFNNLFVRDPVGAKAYYEANRKGIDATKYDEIEQRLKTGVGEAEGTAGGGTVFDKFMAGKTPNDPIPRNEIDKEIRDQFSGDPLKLKAAQAEANRRAALWNQQQAEFTAEAASKVSDLFEAPDASLVAIKRTNEWRNLTGQQRMAFEERWTAKQNAIEDRAFRLKQRDLVELQRRELEQARRDRERDRALAPAALIYSDPNNLARMSRADVLNMLPTFGPRLTESILRDWQSYQSNQSALSDAKVDNDAFNSAVAAVGHDPKPNHNNKDESLWVWSARQAVENRIGAEQKALGRPLDRKRKDELIQEVINSKVLMPGQIYGVNEIEEFRVDPAELAAKGSVYVQANAKDKIAVKLSSIPAQDYTDTVRFLRERGRPTTAASVAQTWYDATKGKK